MRLLFSILAQSPADSVFKSACSYIEALAASSVASAVFFQSPIACQLVQVLRSTCTNWHAIGDWKNTADATDDAASASM